MSTTNDPQQFRRFMSSSRPIDLDGIDWDAVPPPPGIRSQPAYGGERRCAIASTAPSPVSCRERLHPRGVQRLVRAIMTRLYTPVGSSHQPKPLARWVSAFLFGDEGGRAAANHVDQTIARLPGFNDVRLLGQWLERNVEAS